MLNPAIYSAHLKLHPLMVLCALVVAEHSMGVWGLLLAVPMTVFALDYIIRWVFECVICCVCSAYAEGMAAAASVPPPPLHPAKRATAAAAGTPRAQ